MKIANAVTTFFQPNAVESVKTPFPDSAITALNPIKGDERSPYFNLGQNRAGEIDNTLFPELGNEVDLYA